MALIAPVNLPYNVRTLWFDPNGLEIVAGDKMVVQTARGLELGVAASEIIEVDESSIKKLKSPLKNVLRIATQEDLDKAEEMERLSQEAMPVFKELARETSEEMHPVSVEYLLDGDKAIFYFEAEERIDFRELVRKLASHFHVRIDMHQIGVRDEARIVGGIAHCGQEVCCKRLGGEFKPVSIRMAKDQDLSLNPQKISGLCGRLMCCLRYETEAYIDFKSRAPKVGAKIKTPQGEAKVVSLDIPKEIVVVQLEDGKPIKVNINGFKEAKEGKRPDTITEEGWEIANREDEMVFESSNIFSTSNFTGEDKLGSATAIHHPTKRSTKKSSQSSKSGESQHSGQQKETHRKQRRRRSTVISGNQPKNDKSSSSENTKSSSQKKNEKQRSSTKLRPGHRSSGLSGMSSESSNDAPKAQRNRSDSKRKNPKNQSDVKKQGGSKQKASSADGQSNNGSNHRKKRRRHDIGKPESEKGAK